MCKLGQHSVWMIKTRGDSERYRTCFTATAQSRMQSKLIGGSSSNASKNVTYYGVLNDSSSLRTVCLVQLDTTIVTTCRFGMLPLKPSELMVTWGNQSSGVHHCWTTPAKFGCRIPICVSCLRPNLWMIFILFLQFSIALGTFTVAAGSSWTA